MGVADHVVEVEEEKTVEKKARKEDITVKKGADQVVVAEEEESVEKVHDFGIALHRRLLEAARRAIDCWGLDHPLRSLAQQEARCRLQEEQDVYGAVLRLRTLAHEYGELARLHPHAAKRALSMAATRLAKAVEEAVYAAALGMVLPG